VNTLHLGQRAFGMGITKRHNRLIRSCGIIQLRTALQRLNILAKRALA
jgi:hypothetical protein